MKHIAAAPTAYYQAIMQAAEEQFELTEHKLRRLEGLKPAQIDKLVDVVHGRHEKLLKRIERQL